MALGRAIRLLVLVGILSLLLAGCGGGGGTTTSSTASATTIQRFCQLQVQGQKLGQRLTAPLEKENAPPAKFKAAERKIAQSNVEKQLEQLLPSLPPDVAQAGQTLLAAQKARAGLGPAVPKQQEAPAENKLKQFTKENCNG